jgi:hypothetical protein
MTHASSRERLKSLLDLAARGAEGRTALLDELTDLLIDWPADYAQAMRGPFEALFEKTARDADAGTRAHLAARLVEHDALPVALINEFFLDAPEPLRAHILKRNAVLDDTDAAAVRADAAALVTAARRTMNGAFVEVFASALFLPHETASAILGDAHAMAVAAKGAGLDRAAYSAVALLSGTGLAAFDEIPQAGATRLVRFWRERG